jgi:autonomous glycyl radical cofactor GrcA
VAKRPRDPNQLAKLIVDIATGEAEDTVSAPKRHPESRRGRAGGVSGGTARAKALTPEQREDIARVAAQARWKKSKRP